MDRHTSLRMDSSLPGELIALADALQGDQAWVRGGICHHDYACSLDAAAMSPGKSL